MIYSPPKSALIQQLRDLVAAVEEPASLAQRTVFSTGCPALDRILPQRGLVQGSLVECLDERTGSGAETLAMLLTRAVKHGVVVVLDRDRQFYPPAMLAWKLPHAIVVVQPKSAADELWAAVQALRNLAVAAVWLRRDRLTAFDFRRLRLAAEEGGSLGILLRSVRARGQPTWADVQCVIRPWPSHEGRRLQVELTRCRGGASGVTVVMELDDVNGVIREVAHHEALHLSTASQLVDSTTPRCPTGVARSPTLVAAP